MEVMTNKLKIKIKNFEENYDVIYLESKKNENYNKELSRSAIIIDTWEKELLSIYCQRSGKYYLLFKKNKISLNQFNSIEEDYNVYLNQFIYNDVKLNLLLNSLTKFGDEEIINCTGHFYQFIKEDDFVRIYLEYRFFKGILQQNVVTFTKVKEKSKKYITYYSNGKNLTLIQKSNKQLLFIKKTLNKRKSKMTFINIYDNKSYQKTKVYYYSKVIKLFQYYLKDIIEIESMKEEFNIKKWKRPNKTALLIQNMLNEIGINIVNSTKDSQCINQLSYLLCHAFKSKNININTINCSDNFMKDKINFQIVYHKEEYIEKKLDDDYFSSQSIAIQHIYLDRLQNEYSKIITRKAKTKRSSIAERILFDGLIKYEIINKLFELAKIENALIPKDWKYYMYISDINNKKHIYLLDFDNSIPKYSEIYDFKIKEKFKMNKSTQYGIMKSNGIFMNIHENQNYHPMPNFQLIEKHLDECDEFGLIEKKEILDLINKFAESYSINYTDKELEIFNLKISNFKENIQNISTRKISRFDVNKAFPTDRKKPQISRKFRDFVYETIHKRLDTELGKDDIIRQYMRGYIHINYKQNMQDIDYTVGKIKENDFNIRLAKSNIIRTLTNCDLDDFEKYAKMLCIDFIRVNQMTAIPFVFKYLREYAYMVNNNIKTE